MHGLLLVNKPAGITSFDIIRSLRKQTGVRKIGHAGTLDPLATGLMLILFGNACRQAQQFSKLDKSYLAVMQLGAVSTTYDAEGSLTEGSKEVPDLKEVERALNSFRGDIQQRPPIYSAIKVGGQRAYKLARAGEEVELPLRKVTVRKLDLLNYAYPVLKLRAEVSSGTYIRSLAHDIGQSLGTGAYLAELVRESVGPYALTQAAALSQIDPQNVANLLIAV